MAQATKLIQDGRCCDLLPIAVNISSDADQKGFLGRAQLHSLLQIDVVGVCQRIIIHELCYSPDRFVTVVTSNEGISWIDILDHAVAISNDDAAAALLYDTGNDTQGLRIEVSIDFIVTRPGNPLPATSKLQHTQKLNKKSCQTGNQQVRDCHKLHSAMRVSLLTGYAQTNVGCTVPAPAIGQAGSGA